MPNRAAPPRSTFSDQVIRCWPACLAIALITLMCTWAIGTPRYGSPDELAHTVKAYGTAHGETIGSAVPDGSPLTRNFEVPAGLLTGDPGCFAFYPQLDASCSIAVNDPHIVEYPTSAATYPPEYYAVVGGLSRLLGTEQSVLSYRLISTLIGACLLALALYFMRRAGGRNAGMALVALSPMTLFMVSSANPASTELAGTFLLWAYVAALLAGDEVASRRQLLVASSIAAGVVLVRPVALPWVAVALGSYLLLERRTFAIDRKTTTRLLALCSLPLVVAVVLSSAWSRYAGVGLTDDKYVVADSTRAILRVGLGRTSELFRQAFGTLGWLDTELPTPTFLLWIACLVLIAALVAFGTDRRVKLTLFAIGAIWILYPAIYVALAKTPLVWQGRYNLPLLGGVAMCGIVGARTSAWPSPADSIARFCAASWVVIEVVAFYQTLRRFMVGSTGSLRLRGGWEPPINVWLLLVANAAMAVAVGWLMTRPGAPAEPSGVDSGTGSYVSVGAGLGE